MTIFSQFTDTGRIGTLNNSQLRQIIVSTSFEQSGQLPTSFSYTCSDTPTALVYHSEITSNTTGFIHFYYTDLTTGKTIITRGPSKTAAGSVGSGIIVNPINGGIIRRDPTNGSTNLFQSLDYGATWTSLGFGTSIFGANIQAGGGGWFDGTNFAFCNTTGSSHFTTNGTGFSTQPTVFYGPVVSGNNRSAFSGYYFSADPSGTSYRYRTTFNGADTTVSGFLFKGMSRNGRYCMRVNTSTNEIQYSNDGGASWSAMSLSSLNAANAYDNLSYLPSDDGTFYIAFSMGNTYYYDFSTSKWTSTFGPDPIWSFAGNADMVRGAVGTNECLFRFITTSSNTIRGVAIMDFPKKFA